jgi:hypothetical protein
VLFACSGDKSSGRDPKAQNAAGSHAGMGVSSGSSGDDKFGNSDASTDEVVLPDGAVLDASGGDIKQPDDDSCGRMVLEPMVNTVVEPGNLIVVFDNSGSMTAAWGDQPRWVVAANALRDAVTSLSEYLTVGAILFPTDSSCAVASLDSGQQIPMLPGSAFVIAWENSADPAARAGSAEFSHARTTLARKSSPGVLDSSSHSSPREP